MGDNKHGDTGGGLAPMSGTADGPRPSQSDRPQEAGATATDIKQKLSDDVQSAKQFAKDGLSEASATAQATATEQKNVLATKMNGVALAFEKVGGELEQGDNRDIGRLARSLGSSMKTFSNDIQDRSLGEVAGMAEDFGRRQPLAFLGLAAIAGLAASRFLTASTEAKNEMAATSSSKTTSPEPQPIGITPSGSTPGRVTSTEGRFNG